MAKGKALRQRGQSMSRAISKDGPVRALGAMSGTSLDGVDAAVLVTDGHDILRFGQTAYRPYTTAERRVIAAGFANSLAGMIADVSVSVSGGAPTLTDS